MRVTLMLDQGELADPRIRLPQPDAKIPGQFHQLLTGPVHQLGIGRERNVLRLHRSVDDDAREFRRLQRAGSGRYRQALLQQRLQPLLAHAIAPVGHRGAIERQPVLEKLLAAEVLVVRVLDPLLAHHLVAQIVAVLENGKPGHQPGRQRRPAAAIGIYRAELLLQKSPVDRPRQFHQRVLHVDDLIEPRPKQILLAAFPTLPWPHRNPSARSYQTKRITASDSRESPTRICKETDTRTPISGKSNRRSSGDFYCRSITSE